MRTTTSGAVLVIAGFVLTAVAFPACGEPPRPEAPPCDRTCLDGAALRALRETMKLAYNLTLQGKPVGFHDQSGPCIRGGTARVFGTATSNAVQGSTDVDLTYVLDRCGVVEKDNEAPENYELTFTGTITQKGTIAVQPSATTALLMKSDAMTFSGTVYSPPVPFEESACPLDVAQNGNDVGGTMCGRTASFSF